jgi:hydrogenase nickel incorporation protein HypB
MSNRVQVVEEITKANDVIAETNRARLDEAGVFALNMLASPGAGKTSLIERVLPLLADRFRVGVVEGDLATSLDAERATAAGAVSVQINTGTCHLDASMVRTALDRLTLPELDVVIVENVGNLICPASFALGTHDTVLVASVPEGDDKPYKYPRTYRGVDVLVVNKTDLLPHVNFDMERFLRGVEALNEGVATFEMSCRTGDGVAAFADWVASRAKKNVVAG